jgi:hypothetical protein
VEKKSCVLFFLVVFAAPTASAVEPAARTPAVPLAVHDPYFSIWSPGDRLAESWPCHWTGVRHALCAMMRVDGKVYRLMGEEPLRLGVPPQTGLQVLPTRTIYDFDAAGVHLRLSFITPLLPDNLDLLSRPVTYLAWDVSATDHRQHEVSLYFDAAAEIVVNRPKQKVAWSRPDVPGLSVMRFGSKDQPVLKKSGDDLRIDWGNLYVAVPNEKSSPLALGEGSGVRAESADRSAAKSAAKTFITNSEKARLGFAWVGVLPAADDPAVPRAADDDPPVAGCVFDLGQVGDRPVSRHILLAYDDEYSIEYFQTKLRPYWRRNGMDAAGLLQTAEKEYANLSRRCAQFDRDLVADLTRVGGPGYANLCAMSYRQALGGQKLAAAPDGRPLLFPKECFSNGCVATVDVIYPGAPILMLFNNELLKAALSPVFEYAAMPRWKHPFAPHDLGTYPKANGQVYGGGEKTEKDQMPVEESADMLILAAVVSRLDGNTAYAEKYWPQLERWAKYLKEKGLDPDKQLCTDDFAGHLAHNTNLSIKAVVALGAYAKMCDMADKQDQAAEYRRAAEEFAKRWAAMADDGDHYRLAFDKPGTWSQKYNLVWDKLLDLRLFAPEVAAREVAFYKTRLNRFGLPLDSRADYTKTDWQVWTATLADSRADFDLLMGPLYDFVNFTAPRVSLTDWYFTTDARKRGFQARPVIGGVFIKMLDDRAAWDMWRRLGQAGASAVPTP